MPLYLHQADETVEIKGDASSQAIEVGRKTAPFDSVRVHGHKRTVANVTALLALSTGDGGVVDGDSASTLGYSTTGVGANDYYYDASSTATINGGFVLPGPGGTMSLDSSGVFNGDAGTGGRWLAKDTSVANLQQFGALGDDSNDDAPAIQAACNAMIADADVGEVYAPPGIYQLARTVTITPTSSSTKFVLRGAGKQRTTIKAANTFTGDALIQSSGHTTTGSDNSGYKWEFSEIADVYFSCWSDGGILDYCVDFGAASHTNVRNVRTTYGVKAGFLIGYNFTNRFENCLFQLATIGFEATNGVNNQATFEHCTFLNNDVGYKCAAGISLEFLGCGFEQNDVCGMFLNAVRGCLVSSYFELNGTTGHTWTTVASGAIDGGNWTNNADVIIASGAAGSAGALPTDIVNNDLCSGILFEGCSATRTGSGGEFVAITAGRHIDIHEPAAGESGLPDDYKVVSLYGGNDYAQDIRATWTPRESQDERGEMARYHSTNVSGSVARQSGLATSRFNWASPVAIDVDLSSMSGEAGSGTFTESAKVYRNQAAYLLGGHTATTRYFSNTSAIDLTDYPELLGLRIVVEVFYWLCCTNYNAGSARMGLQLETNGVASGASIEAKELWAETTGGITASANSLTVSDADGILPGRWVVVDGAGPSGGTLVSYVTAVSGTTVTLADNAGTTVASADVLVPKLKRFSHTFTPTDTDATIDIAIRAVASGTNAYDSIAIRNIVVREMGSPGTDQRYPQSDVVELRALSADPSDPPNGQAVQWVSDGTGSGDDGDLMAKITDSGGTTKTVTIVDYSAS